MREDIFQILMIDWHAYVLNATKLNRETKLNQFINCNFSYDFTIYILKPYKILKPGGSTIPTTLLFLLWEYKNEQIKFAWQNIKSWTVK